MLKMATDYPPRKYGFQDQLIVKWNVIDAQEQVKGKNLNLINTTFK
jgi:hypothetical protein